MTQPMQPQQAQPHDQQVALRAYERWVRRGRPLGDGTQDWLAACAELEMEQARKAYEIDVAIFDE